jgi:hypothetical protein
MTWVAMYSAVTVFHSDVVSSTMSFDYRSDEGSNIIADSGWMTTADLLILPQCGNFLAASCSFQKVVWFVGFTG